MKAQKKNKKKRGGRRSLKLDIRITNDVDELRESVLSRELTEFCQEQKMRELGFEPYERASELYEDLPAHEDDEKWSNFDGIVS